MTTPEIRFKDTQGRDFPCWSQSALGSLCRLYQPTTLSKQNLDETGPFAVYGANGIIGRHSKFNHAEPEVVVSCRGDCGSVHMTKPYSWINGNAMVVHSENERILKKDFLNYLLSSKNFQSIITGGAQPQITRGNLSTFVISFPIVDEQQKIATFFSTLDKKISLSERKLEALEQLKKGLMQKIFSQTFRFKSLSGATFPSWRRVPLGNCGKIITGKTPPTNNKSNYGEDIPFCSPGDLGTNKYINQTEKNISHLGAQSANIIPKNSILITCIGSTIGKLGIANKEMATNQQINSLIVNSDYSSEFIYYAINFNFKLFLKSVGTQAVPIINKTSLSQQIISVPTLEEQYLIANLLSCLDHKIDLNRNRLKLLSKIKQGFMQQMFV